MAESGKKSTGKAGGEQHESVQGAEPQGPQAGKGDPKVAATAAEAYSHTRTAEPAGSGDQGPGTKQVEVAEDRLSRGQARMHIGAGHVAAPIEAPDTATQTDPPEGYSRSSTNPVAGLRGVATYTGENHVRLTDQDGKDLVAADIFEPHGENETSRTTKVRVYEEFNYAGSLSPMTRLLYPAGHRVDLWEAARVEDAVKLGHAQLAQEKAAIDEENARFYGTTPQA